MELIESTTSVIKTNNEQIWIVKVVCEKNKKTRKHTMFLL